MNEENEIILSNESLSDTPESIENSGKANSDVGVVTQEQVDEITRQVVENMILNGSLRGSGEEEEQTEEQTEEVTEENSEELSINFLDPKADHHLYLSSEVENASINDLYSIALSTRNILLLMLLIFICYKLYSMMKSVVYKMFNN